MKEKEWIFDTEIDFSNPSYDPAILTYLSAHWIAPHFNKMTNIKGRLTEAHGYNQAGLLKSICLYSYNTQGLPKWEITQYNNGTSKITSQIAYPEYNLRNSLKTEYVDVGLNGPDITYEYLYDGFNRMTETKVDGNRLATYDYDDALGLIKGVKYFATCPGGSAVQVDDIAYSYDLRDRLTKINSKLYTEELFYDNAVPTSVFPVTATKNFNGNINGTVHTYNTTFPGNGSVVGQIMDGKTYYGYTSLATKCLVGAEYQCD